MMTAINLTHNMKNISIKHKRNDILSIKKTYEINMLHTETSVKDHHFSLLPMIFIYFHSHYKNYHLILRQGPYFPQNKPNIYVLRI